MKMKHLIMVSLILAILTIGAVSASEDDVLAVDDVEVDDVSASVDEDVVSDEDDNTYSENTPVELTKDDFKVEIKSKVNLSNDDEYVIQYTCPENIAEDSYIQVVLDDVDFCFENLKANTHTKIMPKELNIKPFIEYNVQVYYCTPDDNRLEIATGTFDVVKILGKEDFDEDKYEDNKVITSQRNGIIVDCYAPVNGKFIVTTNKGQKDELELEAGWYSCVDIHSLNICENGTYEINVKFISEEGLEIDIETFSVTVDIDWSEPYDSILDLKKEVNLLDKSSIIVNDYDEFPFIGKLTIKIDGIQYYYQTLTEEDDRFEIRVNDLPLIKNIVPGNHTVYVECINDYENHSITDTVLFYEQTNVYAPELMATGEDEYIIVSICEGTTGKVIFYKWDDIEGIYYEFNSSDIVDGIAKMPLNSLKEGEYEFKINVTSNKHPEGEEFIKTIRISNNTEGFAFDVTPKEITFGEKINLTITIPINGDSIYIYLDDVLFKVLFLVEFERSTSISGLTVGTHKIGVKYELGSTFYSNSTFVTVKEKIINETPVQPPIVNPTPVQPKADVVKLTLKTVKVKKSAKKLVLQATLKINGKTPKKGTKVIFKFNGKSYKAKTNAKGVAKYTITKKVLKKLKVGKKVKYQVSYGKKTVKKSVKIKK